MTKMAIAMEVANIFSTLQPPWLQTTKSPLLWNNKRNPKFQHLLAKAKGFNKSPTKIKIDGENVAGKTSIRKKTDDADDEDDDDNDEKIPQIVFNRMTIRIVGYVGVPMAIGIAFLQLISVLKEDYGVDVPIWVAFLTSLLSFGASALGIAYGTLSTSWDAQSEGSFLGFEQVQKNWVDMWNEDEDNGDSS